MGRGSINARKKALYAYRAGVSTAETVVRNCRISVVSRVRSWQDLPT